MDGITACLQIWIPYVPRFLLKRFPFSFFFLFIACARAHIQQFRLAIIAIILVDGFHGGTVFFLCVCVCVNERQFINNTQQLVHMFCTGIVIMNECSWNWVKSESTKCTEPSSCNVDVFTIFTCYTRAVSEIWNVFFFVCVLNRNIPFM